MQTGVVGGGRAVLVPQGLRAPSAASRSSGTCTRQSRRCELNLAGAGSASRRPRPRVRTPSGAATLLNSSRRCATSRR
eukprot:2434695-Pyramimonas_sp.AAC.2